MPEQDMLYCVGCGRTVAPSRPGQTLAIACACGAMAPILVTEDGMCSLPSSLVLQRFGDDGPPHLEYYLGYSYHQSENKDKITQGLKELGSISQQECRQDECRRAWWRGIKQQREIRDNKLADALELVVESMEQLQNEVIAKEGRLPEGWPQDPMESTNKIIAMLRGEEDEPPIIPEVK